ncbi:hypothetical protein ACH5RR_023849 [Cinchona calisaya]|uniref:Uncharacterized protein n=1 Tax=Cinchona calisaya TaxID=153742 RepID=A0ABD2ZFP4_9GENT
MQLGLLESDNYVEYTLEEAVVFQMPSSLRLLFATLLAFCSPTNPTLLWEKFEPDLSRDFEWSKGITQFTAEQIKRNVLQDINTSLELMGKSIDSYHLIPEKFQLSHTEKLTKELQSEKIFLSLKKIC